MELEILIYVATGFVGLSGLGYILLRKPSKPKSIESSQSKPVSEHPLQSQPADLSTKSSQQETSPLETDHDHPEAEPSHPEAKPSHPEAKPKDLNRRSFASAQDDSVEVQDGIEDKGDSEPHAQQRERRELKSLEDALIKTREGFWGKLKSQFSGKPSIDASEVEDLEEALYTSDLGPRTVDQLIRRISAEVKTNKLNLEELHASLRSEISGIFSGVSSNQLKTLADTPTTVWMVVGVNGAGKTTSIGKLASQQVALGKRVLIAAGDTFRAAADEQLKVWANRAEVEIFSPEGIKDPSAVAFDAIKKGSSKGFDLVIIDTAGRLHTQKNLMEELKKMKRVMAKALDGTPHETLLVLDANSGQNALMQAEQFHQALEVTGVILTKMDGSAKGGVAVGIANEQKIPIKMIGVGESIEDLRPFNPEEFVDSIL